MDIDSDALVDQCKDALSLQGEYGTILATNALTGAVLVVAERLAELITEARAQNEHLRKIRLNGIWTKGAKYD